ncbi:RbsD/FucU domain-containing protein, partial [Enterococcus lactis]|uniref:RbsD/FucU domain-containing protein n=1 Tax=Enterococcus lactis TaxID=357441 RepID=UPI002FD879B2
MKKGKVINSDISRVIAQMGFGTEKIDLAVSNGLPSFLSVLENILEELEVQSIELAEEI